MLILVRGSTLIHALRFNGINDKDKKQQITSQCIGMRTSSICWD